MIIDEEIKRKYIENFGVELWKKEEMIGKMIELSIDITNYLKIEMVPILFEDINVDSRLYLNEGYIAISEKHVSNYIECAKCVCHELRHVYQLYLINLSSDLRSFRFKYEIMNPVILNINSEKSIYNYMMQEIEIDAFAFTKWYMDKFLNVDVIHKIKPYEEIIKEYIKKNF